MFFLFGWNHQTKKDYGPTLPIKCPNCNNDVFWHLVHSRDWLTVFFVPVIPYKSKHSLLCEVCSQGIELNDTQISKAKKLNQTTLAFFNKEITKEEYMKAVKHVRVTLTKHRSSDDTWCPQVWYELEEPEGNRGELQNTDPCKPLSGRNCVPAGIQGVQCFE